MNKLKTFINTTFFTFTDPNYYGDILKAKFSFSVKYFLLFYLLVSIGMSIYSYVFVSKNLSPKIEPFLSALVDSYPDDLIIKFDANDSLLSTEGVEEPVFIPLPEIDYIDTNIENLLVIDTVKSAEDISEYSTLLFATDSHISTISDTDGGYQIFPFSEMTAAMNENDQGWSLTSLTLDKSFLTSNLPMMKMFVNQIFNYIPLIVFVSMLLFLIVSRLLVVLFYSLFTLVISMILGINLNFGKAYQLGLHSITVADGITKLSLLVFGVTVPMLFGAIFLGVITLSLVGVKKTK